MTPRTRLLLWVALAAAFVVLLAIGFRATPTEGTSQDRLYSIADDLRCLQCAGESVANSQAPIAITMRSEIESQMAQGQTDDEIMAYFSNSYGPRVLLNPPSDGVAGLIWVLPVVVTGAAMAGLLLSFGRWGRARRGSAARDVTDDDRRLVEAQR